MTRRTTPAAGFLLLAVLADADRHGCGIAPRVWENPGSLVRASDADRDHVIDMLKAAFVQGQLTRDELEVRVGQALTSRTHAGLAALTADIPAGLPGARLLPLPGIFGASTGRRSWRCCWPVPATASGGPAWPSPRT